MKKLFAFFTIMALGTSMMAQYVMKPEEVHKHRTYIDIFQQDTITTEMNFWCTFYYNNLGLVSKADCYIDYAEYGNEFYSWSYWYDQNGRVIKYSRGGYDGGGIIGDDSTFYFYNGDLLMYSLKLYVNKWGGWYYTDSIAYHYYEDGSLRLTERYGRDLDDLYWESMPYRITENIQTETGIEMICTQFYDLNTGSIYYRETTHYDTNNNILDFLYEKYNGYDDLKQGYMITYEYADGLCQTRTREKWVPGSSSWVNDSSYLFQYDEWGHRTEEVSRTWAGGEWQNVQRTSWEMDERGLCHNITRESWVDETFTNNKKVEYQYDETGLCTGLLGFVWSGESWVYGVGGYNEPIFWDESLHKEDVLTRALSFGFSDVDITWQTIQPNILIEENLPIENTFSVYPNPANNVLFVKTQCFASQPTTTAYRITNLMGQTMQTGCINADYQQINIENLPAGLYFITAGEKTVKFVKQ